MSFSIEAEKNILTNSILLYNKISQKIGNRGELVQSDQGHLTKTNGTNIILSDDKQNVPSISNKARFSVIITSV